MSQACGTVGGVVCGVMSLKVNSVAVTGLLCVTSHMATRKENQFGKDEKDRRNNQSIALTAARYPRHRPCAVTAVEGASVPTQQTLSAPKRVATPPLRCPFRRVQWHRPSRWQPAERSHSG
jgi:hypothetical protein